jgi:hypothetical protein
MIYICQILFVYVLRMSIERSQWEQGGGSKDPNLPNSPHSPRSLFAHKHTIPTSRFPPLYAWSDHGVFLCAANNAKVID